VIVNSVQINAVIVVVVVVVVVEVKMTLKRRSTFRLFL